MSTRLAWISLVACVMMTRMGGAGEFQWAEASPQSLGMSGEKLDALRDSLQERSSKALLVIRNDKIVYEWYSPDHGPNKNHYTASAAKALVGGVSLAVAIHDGRIRLDDAAARFVPQWEKDPLKSKITIRQLGSHTSGLDDAEADELPHDKLTGWKGQFWKRLDPPGDPFSIARDQTPVLFEPGEDFQYSNPGIAMLSYAVTVALKDGPQKDLRTLLRDRIMRPIGAADQSWSVGYGRTFEVDGLPFVAAWGGGAYTARSAARVARLMLREGDWDGTRLLSREAVQNVTNDAGLPYGCGMGWFSNARKYFQSLPGDAFFAAGAGHQIVLVVPSLKLICVRNGGDLSAGVETTYEAALQTGLFDPLMECVVEGDSGQTSEAADPQKLMLRTRSRIEQVPDSGTYAVVTRDLFWDARKTALIICDMWDDHTCKAAAARVAEMAPAVNQAVKAARDKGVLIIHAPSSRTSFYQDTPARRRALDASFARPPVQIGSQGRNPEREGRDGYDFALGGGCGCETPCPGWVPDERGVRQWRGEKVPWTRQIETIDLADEDAISSDGQEIYNLLQQRGIENIIMLGVHTNQCIVGRPFGIRQMVYLGKNVVLCRDLTDALFQPKSPDFDHFRGTDRVVEHIEKYWCPTITSTTLTGEPAFRFRDDMLHK